MKNFFKNIFKKKNLTYKDNKILYIKYSRVFKYKSIDDHFHELLNYWEKSDLNFRFSNDLIKFKKQKKLTKINPKYVIKYYFSNLDNIPYYDLEEPCKIYFNKDKKLFSVQYRHNEKLGFLRRSLNFPVWFELENEKIKKELYSFHKNNEDGSNIFWNSSTSESCYSIPFYISYNDDFTIDSLNSFWILHQFKGEKNYLLSHREYKEILKPLEIDLDNFRKFSDGDVKLIKYYLMDGYNPTDFSNICSKEDIIENLYILKMLSY